MLMTWGPEMQECCRPSYTKCSYVLSTMSQVPASWHRRLARSSSSLLIMMPAHRVQSCFQAMALAGLAHCAEISAGGHSPEITSWVAGIDNRHHLGRVWALKLLLQPVQVRVPVIGAALAVHKACTRASRWCSVSPGRCHRNPQALAGAAPPLTSGAASHLQPACVRSEHVQLLQEGRWKRQELAHDSLGAADFITQEKQLTCMHIR